jgi:hypothetical protein
MKYALVNGKRQEAQPDLAGVCPACDSPMVPRCGDVRVHHWAHLVGSDCDHWWESETEWHRKWKDLFPVNWQEVVHAAESGEKHIADVKTDQDWVLEFQHSNIQPEERKAREAFYQKLIWIVDGARRERDKVHFFKAWQDGELVYKELSMRRIRLPNQCALLRDWAGSRKSVLFDFSGFNEPEDAQPSQFELFRSHKPLATHLWWLVGVVDEMAYMVPFGRAKFVQYHIPEAAKNARDFAKLLEYLRAIVGAIARPRQRRPLRDVEFYVRLSEQIFGKPRVWKSRRF